MITSKHFYFRFQFNQLSFIEFTAANLWN